MRFDNARLLLVAVSVGASVDPAFLEPQPRGPDVARRWRLREAVWDNRKAQLLRCVPLAHYGWKAFGFDGEHKPVWTIADYLKGGA